MVGSEVALEKEDRQACVDTVEFCKMALFLKREGRLNFHLADGRIAAVAVVLECCLLEASYPRKQQAIVDLAVKPS
jgi:hypothetical protein